MAKSAAHKWGQIVGDFLEELFEAELASFAKKHNLYLDKKGIRPARNGKKVTWIDSYGNAHDLDFVLERNGDANHIGEPVAFIESAWRRYTKHSRNKAQEIQGAILPLVATHKNFAPFIGVILAGEFTHGALVQLKSIGFNVLYFPYEMILKAFDSFGIDAGSEESTSEKEFQNKIKKWSKLRDKNKLAETILQLNADEIETFFSRFEKSVSRYIIAISVTPLHGQLSRLNSIDQAIKFIKTYNATSERLPVVKYEITIKYNNEDIIEGVFNDAEAAIGFLSGYLAPLPA